MRARKKGSVVRRVCQGTPSKHFGKNGSIDPVDEMLESLMTSLRIVAEVVGLIGMLVGAIGGITYALFKRWGDNWLDAKFKERLAKYKHEQQKELEELRLEINTLFDRTIKLHQREFEVLPEAWTKLIDAYRKAQTLIAHLQSYPDLDRMSDVQLKAFFEKCPLPSWKRDEIMASENRTNSFSKAIFWHQLYETKQVLNDTHTYLLRNGIFLPEKLKLEFDTFSELLWHAVLEREHRQSDDSPTRLLEPKQDELRTTGLARLNILEKEVCQRLWSAQRAPFTN